MVNQLGFSSVDYPAKKKCTKREVFFGDDGGHRAVDDARSRDRTELSEARIAGRTAAVPAPTMLGIYCL